MERPAIGTVRAVYDYEATAEDELTLVGGKTYELLAKNENGWWEGRSATKRGVFPANFVEEIEDLKGKAPAPSRTTLADSGESSIALVPLSASAPAPAPAPAPARARAPSMTVANVAPPAPPVLKPKGARRNSMEMVRVADAARNRQKKKDPARQNLQVSYTNAEPPLWMKNSNFVAEANCPEFLPQNASDEILMHIFGYLDDKSLLRCACVCKKFQQVTEDRRLWVQHNRRKFKKSKDNRTEGKQFFLAEMHKNFEAAKQRREIERQRREADAQRLRLQEIASDWAWPTMILCHCNAYDTLVVILFLLFGVFVALRADRKITWKYGLVCIPLFIMSGILLIRSITFLIPQFRIVISKDNEDSESYSSLSSGGEMLLIEDALYEYGEPKMHWTIRYPVKGLAISIFTVISFFLLLIALKLSGVNMSARVVIIPFLVAYVLLLFHAGIVFYADREWLLSGVPAALLLPWIVYAILIALKIDNVLHCSWMVVNIPGFIGLLAAACGPFIASLFNGCDDCGAAIAIFFGLLCCPAAPIVAFQVIIALKLDGGLLDASWRVLFVPFYILLAGVCCTVTVTNLVRMFGSSFFGDDD